MGLAAFTGLTAIPCGVLLMLRPDGSMLQVAPSALSALTHNSPFHDFLIPGLVLAVVVGGSMICAATLLFQRRPYALEMAMVAGAALVLFEIVEYFAIGFMPLLLFEGLVGALVLGMAARRRLATSRPEWPAPRGTAAKDLVRL